MNAAKTNDGGWEACGMREWLAGEGMALLPEDLQKVLVSVEKQSNDAGSDATAASVVTTSDTLWLFSTAEVCGETSCYGDERDTVVNGEGAQYQLFSDCEVDAMGPNAISLKSTLHNSAGRYKTEDATADKDIKASTRVWWLRTADPSDYSHRFRCVRSDGDPATNVLCSYAEGVAPGSASSLFGNVRFAYTLPAGRAGQGAGSPCVGGVAVGARGCRLRMRVRMRRGHGCQLACLRVDVGMNSQAELRM